MLLAIRTYPFRSLSLSNTVLRTTPVLSRNHLATRFTSAMAVTTITSLAQFHEIINGDKPVAIDFWATWCGPCRIISPIFEKMAAKHEGVGFYKVDVDEVQAVSHEASIRAMPTFQVYHKGNKVNEVVGAIPMKLQALITQAEGLTQTAQQEAQKEEEKQEAPPL